MPSRAAASGSSSRARPRARRARAETGPPGDVVSAARAAGWLVVVAARERDSLPGGWASVLVTGSSRSHPHVRARVGSAGARWCRTRSGVWWSDRLARALAPLRCADPARVGATVAGRGRPPGPPRVGRDGSRGDGRGMGAATARGGGLAPPAAVVGSGPHGIHSIDLSRDGPHVLVGGTTGSGKSEFLRTLVVSLAISTPPSDLTLVLVDFKGGAAFGPCARPPPRRRAGHRPRRPPRGPRPDLPARRAPAAGADARGRRRPRPRGLRPIAAGPARADAATRRRRRRAAHPGRRGARTS